MCSLDFGEIACNKYPVLLSLNHFLNVPYITWPVECSFRSFCALHNSQVTCVQACECSLLVCVWHDYLVSSKQHSVMLTQLITYVPVRFDPDTTSYAPAIPCEHAMLLAANIHLDLSVHTIFLRHDCVVDSTYPVFTYSLSFTSMSLSRNDARLNVSANTNSEPGR